MRSTPRYGEALAWADDLHRDQRRKGKPVPYISHLIAVEGFPPGEKERHGRRGLGGWVCGTAVGLSRWVHGCCICR